MRMIMGLVELDAGEIYVLDEPMEMPLVASS
jgi:hypothetical protein